MVIGINARSVRRRGAHLAIGLTATAIMLAATACDNMTNPPPDGGCSGMLATMDNDSFFVAGSFGNDAAQGTADQPLSTIQAGIELADQSGGGDV